MFVHLILKVGCIMESYPSESEFISLFECLPLKKDEEELFEYSESTFRFQINQYKYEVMVCPFYNQFSLIIQETQENKLIGRYNFQTISKIEILTDKRDESSLRLFLEDDRDRFLMIVEITFKPNFKVEIKETFF
ncbi:hypothetical protein ABES25_18525 [Bacillus gobiensis]|uniref:hypothetical protein n=1 Tax=Bacillus gobiensis TaxID=1441095 RepID=UPI003D1F0997